jgi:hypothetical protein
MVKILTGSALIAALSFCNDMGSDKNNNDSEKSTITVLTMDTLTPQEKSAGWQLLFDGQTTKGWHTYGSKSVGSAWKISEGTLYLDTLSKINGKILGGGDLTTDDEFENFDLKLQWKISKNGNSGVIFLVQEDTAKYKESYITGPEMQMLDNDGHPDGKIQKHRAGGPV